MSEPSPVALRVAAGLAALLVAGVVAASQLLGGADDPAPATPTSATSAAAPRTTAVPLVAVDAPAAGSPECRRLTAKLPAELPHADTPLRRLPLAAPAPQSAAAWGTGTGDPVVLRCGLSRPAELTRTSSLLVIDKVQWLRVQGAGATTWYTVDRPVYIALTTPADTGTGPLQELSTTVADTLPTTPIQFP